MHKSFERNLDIDLSTRKNIVAQIDEGKLEQTRYTQETLEYRDRSLELFEIFERAHPGDIAPLHGDNFESHVCFTACLLPKKKDVLWIEYNADISGDMKSVAAYFWDTKSRSAMVAGPKIGERSRAAVPGKDGFRTQLTSLLIDCPVPYAPRFIENYCVLSSQLDDNQLSSVTISKLPTIQQTSDLSDHVRLDVTSVLRITHGKIRGTSRVLYVVGISLNGTNARFIKKRIVPALVYSLNHAQHYFSRLRPLSALEPHDGDVLANDLLLKLSTSQSTQQARDDGGVRSICHRVVKHLIADYDGLTEVASKYYWFPSFMEIVLENKFAAPKSDNILLRMASTGDARHVAMGFSSYLAACTSPETAVEDWVLNYELLQEFSFENPWFKSMMRSIAAYLLRTATWGTTVRILSGASVALLESVFRILLIISLLSDESESRDMSRAFAQANIAVVSVSVLVQVTLVLVFHGKTSRSNILRQLALVLTFFKPVYDALQIAGSKKAEPGSRVDPVNEMIYFKIVKLLFESVPSSVFMMIAFVFSSSLRSFGSGIISIASIAFASVSMAYDKDTDPSCRAMSPSIYGIFPDGQRMTSFFFLLIFSFCWTLMKTMSISLIYSLSPYALVGLFGSSLALFIAVKLAMGEFHYWVHSESRIGRWGIALAARSIVFLTVEICALFQARHNYEYGGRLFFSHLLLSYVTVVVSVVLYARFEAPEEDEGVRSVAFSQGLGVLSVVAFVSLGAFLWLMPSGKLRGLLFGDQSSASVVRELWNHPSAKVKLEIFSCDISLIRPLEPQIKKYFEDNFAVLVAQGEITHEKAQRIPQSLLPTFSDSLMSQRLRESKIESDLTALSQTSKTENNSLQTMIRFKERAKTKLVKAVSKGNMAIPPPPMAKFLLTVDLKSEKALPNKRRLSVIGL